MGPRSNSARTNLATAAAKAAKCRTKSSDEMLSRPASHNGRGPRPPECRSHRQREAWEGSCSSHSGPLQARSDANGCRHDATYPDCLELQVIGMRALIMPRGRQKIEPLAIEPAVGEALES